MRTLLLIPILSSWGFAQGYVRPWAVVPPAKDTATAGTLHSVMLDAPPPSAPKTRHRTVTLEIPEAKFPLPLLLTPCTTFPGNPVFVIEGDKITMRKLDR